MLKFECKDMGMDCDFVTTAETKAEVIQAASAHAAEMHADMLKSLTPEQMAGLPAQLDSVIKAVAA